MKNSSIGASIALTLTLLSFAACQKSTAIEPEKSPTADLLKVLICGVYDITTKSVKIKAESNLSESSEVGVCWSDANPQPTIYDLKTSEKTKDNVFTATIKNLKAETIYFVRAYKLHESKAIYSDVMTIKTLKKTVDAIQKER
jgi:hypothetical protein